jgi:hypothetical protein
MQSIYQCSEETQTFDDAAVGPAASATARLVTVFWWLASRASSRPPASMLHILQQKPTIQSYKHSFLSNPPSIHLLGPCILHPFCKLNGPPCFTPSRADPEVGRSRRIAEDSITTSRHVSPGALFIPAGKHSTHGTLEESVSSAPYFCATSSREQTATRQKNCCLYRRAMIQSHRALRTLQQYFRPVCRCFNIGCQVCA